MRFMSECFLAISTIQLLSVEVFKQIWLFGMSSVETFKQVWLFAVSNNSSGKAVEVVDDPWAGQKISGSFNHDGPVHQSWWLARISAEIPREAQSAGLSAVGTKFHLSASIMLWIFATRFATKVFHFRGISFNHAIVTWESVQAKISGFGKRLSLMAARVASKSWAPSNAAHSSRRGTQSDLIGATRVLAAIIWVCAVCSNCCRT